MFLRCSQTYLYLFSIDEHVPMHTTLHVSLGCARAYVSPFPPASGPGNMFASREIFVIVVRLWFHQFTIKDAPAICPERLCCYVFRLGPY